MKHSILSRALATLGAVSAFAMSNAGMVGLWQMNGSYSSAMGGQALAPFGNVTFVSDTVGSSTRNVLEMVPGATPAEDYFLTVLNPIGANGGGARSNQYTIVMDIKVDPTVGDASYQSLLQTGSTHATAAVNAALRDNDGDWFLQVLAPNSGGMGISGDYLDSETVPFLDYTIWNRVALTIDNTIPTGDAGYRSYINGVLQNQVQSPSRWAVDGRFSLNTTQFWLFGDEDHEMQKTRVGTIAIFDSALSAAEVAALGSAGTPVTPPVSVSGTLTLGNYIASAPGSAVVPVTFKVLDASDNVLQTSTKNISTSAGVGAYSLTLNSGITGSIKLAVSGPTWLVKTTTTTAGATGVNMSLLNGNAVPDGVIDIADYTTLATAFDAVEDTDLETPGNQSSSNWNVLADFNRDGIVDIADYTILATNFDQVDN